jgi:uncharacterized NAD-dependent epimerase/dehydratase family protein
MDLSRATYLILAEGALSLHGAKTASSAIRYLPERVTAVIDSTHAGRTIGEVLGFGGAIPIVASLEEGLARGDVRPTALLIGVAPRSGRLPADWIPLVARAAEQGLHVVSGLHDFLADVPAIRAAAERAGVAIVDLRRPPADLPVSTGRAREVDAFTVLTVGTDCNIGKMTAGLEIRRGLEQAGARVAFAPTGQTGILIEGWGIAVDAVVSDFVAGAAERLVLEGARRVGPGGIVLVEGQGALIHPGYSAVTLGLLHGTLPSAMILCHDASRTRLRSDGVYDFVRMSSLTEAIRMNEAMLEPLRPARVIGIAIKTAELPEAEARLAVQRAEEETGLPATDPVRFGPEPLVRAILEAAGPAAMVRPAPIEQPA